MQNMFSPISNKITLLHNLLSQYPPLESCTVPTIRPITNTPVPFLPSLFNPYHHCPIPTTPVPFLPPLFHSYHRCPILFHLYQFLFHPYHPCPIPTTPVRSLPPLPHPYLPGPTPTTTVPPLPYHLVPSRSPIPSQPLSHLTCEDRYSGCFPSSIVSQQSSDLSLEHVQV